MGLPFASGHVLAFRRFPSSSVGPSYTSIWHRDPEKIWTFYSDVEPALACPRYFSSAVAHTVRAAVAIRWTGPNSVELSIDGGRELRWVVDLGPTLATRAMTAAGRLMPARLWHSPRALQVLGPLAAAILRIGKVALHGVTPNGQEFVANPRMLWAVAASQAMVRGVNLGPPGALAEQARLGGFFLPQRGMFVIGEAFFRAPPPTRSRLDS